MDAIASLLIALPDVLVELRLQAGYRTLTAAANAVRQNTGRHISPSSISEWERGASSPRIDRLITYLAGIGSSLADLHRELELQPPSVDFAARLRAAPDLHRRVVTILKETGGDGATTLIGLLEETPKRRQRR